MNEKDWVHSIVGTIQEAVDRRVPNLVVKDGQKLPYAYQILSYTDQGPEEVKRPYQTDLLVSEGTDQKWTPRLIIEAKINSVTTHDVITYSQKAAEHKTVHPYLRYGILVGNRKHHPLPGRLFRHGIHFDFMLSWEAFEPSPNELNDLIYLIVEEVKISRNLEDIFFNSQSKHRARYTFLHRPLKLK